MHKNFYLSKSQFTLSLLKHEVWFHAEVNYSSDLRIQFVYDLMVSPLSKRKE